MCSNGACKWQRPCPPVRVEECVEGLLLSPVRESPSHMVCRARGSETREEARACVRANVFV